MINSKIAKFLTFLIPIKKYRKLARKKIENFLYIPLVKKIKKKQIRLHQEIQKKSSLNVIFFVMYDSIFPAKSLFEAMNKDTYFNPCIVIIPDTTRGEKNMHMQMEKTFNTFHSEYSKVFFSYDKSTKKFIDYSRQADLICFSNPYDNATNQFYQISYCSNFTLTFHIPYSYTGFLNYNKKIFSSIEYVLLWKIFVENEDTLKLIKENQIYQANNLILSGYSKMDTLIQNKKNNRLSSSKTTIMIAPHHTIKKDSPLNLSNFLRLSDFYLELPKLYPNIHFIFRPHPLLFLNLKNSHIWNQETIDNYISQLTQHTNLTYENGGDYFDSFLNSSALIHDCGSFIAEYLYLDQPECFIIQNQKQIDTEFTPAGKNLLQYLYIAQNKNDIINFIDEIVLKNQDYLKQKRIQFAKQFIKINYPNATQYLINFLKKELK
ncbi:hypothetical protein BGG37_00750 [Campylobacter lari]|nr:hypothetical protein [Campylobacter lari]